MRTTDQHSPPSVVDDSWKTKPARIVVDALAGVAPGRVLDIGAASGRTALYLARRGWEIKHYEEEYTGWVVPEGKSEAGRLVAGKPTKSQ